MRGWSTRLPDISTANLVAFHSGASQHPGEIGGVEKRKERRWIIAQVNSDLHDVGKLSRIRRDGTSANGGSYDFWIGGAMAAFAWEADNRRGLLPDNPAVLQVFAKLDQPVFASSCVSMEDQFLPVVKAQSERLVINVERFHPALN